MMSGPVVKISKAAIEGNLRALHARAGGRALLPVIKADAYGHSAALVARVCEASCSEAELPYFLVARVDEARALRRQGIRRPLLVLSSFTPEDFVDWPVDTELVVASARDVEACANRPRDARLSAVHLNVNTGMNRLGLRAAGGLDPGAIAEVVTNAERRLRDAGLETRGIMSHLARAEEDPALGSAQQVKLFGDIVRGLPWTPPWIHIANSEGTARGLADFCTGVRPGLHLYGLFQSLAEQRDLGLTPIARVEAPLRQIFWAERGEGLGYGHRFVCPRRTLVGTVPLGYADGIRRSLSRRADEPFTTGFMIDGHRVPIAGTVSMDLTMIDLTDHPVATAWGRRVDAGEEPSLTAMWIGPGQSVELLARATGTIAYEITCALGHRIPRVLDEGKGA